MTCYEHLEYQPQNVLDFAPEPITIMYVHVYPAQVDVNFDQPNTRVGGGEIIHL